MVQFEFIELLHAKLELISSPANTKRYTEEE